MEKKTYSAKTQAKMAAAIMRKAVKISNNTPHDVFCVYSPHVKWIEVHIHIGGWYPDATWVEHKVSFNEYNDPAADFAKVMSVLDDLQKDD